ncbi:hypothetical protein LCGC14_2855930, partial [marine sediment metagenome]
STTVLDDDGNTHDLDTTAFTNTLSETGKVGTGCLNLAGGDAPETPDVDAFTFIEGTNGTFSVSAWVFVTDTAALSIIMSKWDTNSKREWILFLTEENKLELRLHDQDVDKFARRTSDTVLENGWRLVTCTYDGENVSWTGATAANFIILYVDGAAAASTATNDVDYVKMENLGSKFAIGASMATDTIANVWPDKMYGPIKSTRLRCSVIY